MKWYQFIALSIVAAGIIAGIGHGAAKALTGRYVEELVEARVEKRLNEMAEEAVENSKPVKTAEKFISVIHVAEKLDEIPNLDYWVIHSSPSNEDYGDRYNISVYLEREIPEVETKIRYESNSLLEAVNKVMEVLELELISEE